MIQRNCGVRRALTRTVAAAVLAMVSICSAAPAGAAPASRPADAGEGAGSEAVLYRVFLKDGGVLVSYGEFASVADKVVLSMPIGGTESTPVLHLISIPENQVEWERT